MVGDDVVDKPLKAGESARPSEMKLHEPEGAIEEAR